VDFKKLLPGATNLPGVFAIKSGGQGPVLDPLLLAGKSASFYKSTTTEPFGVAFVLLGSIKLTGGRPVLGAFPRKSIVLLNSSSGIVCRISLCSEGLTRA
jgi:hypothetical protein